MSNESVFEKWALKTEDGDLIIRSESGESIAGNTQYYPRIDSAAMSGMVRDHNACPALVAALRELLDKEKLDDDDARLCLSRLQARAALAAYDAPR